MSLQGQPAIQQEYRNPVVLQRADPWVYKHTTITIILQLQFRNSIG